MPSMHSPNCRRDTIINIHFAECQSERLLHAVTHSYMIMVMRAIMSVTYCDVHISVIYIHMNSSHGRPHFEGKII